MIKTLSIHGFRGFGRKQTVRFALPDGVSEGSGLTTIIGANNSGKTTILEAIRAFNTAANEAPSFSEGRRNHSTGGRVSLALEDETGKCFTIASADAGGSTTVKNEDFTLSYYVLQSRRFIPFEFGKNSNWGREFFILNSQKLEDQRSASLNFFEARIFQIMDEKDRFDAVLGRVLGKDLEWTVEQRDSGQYYIKYSKGGVTHSSEGVGDGIWSVFTICAALYDSVENSTVVIDEPELSIHPVLQKRLMRLFLEYSRDRQIILSTHSAHFVNWDAIVKGAQLIRVSKDGVDSICHSISDECRGQFRGILRDLNNPHTLGTDATEALFLEDNVILVEGQEDVVIFNRFAAELEIEIDGDFFGWGVGGAPKMPAFLRLFKDLGYQRVVAVFDGDKKEEAERLREQYPSYKLITLETDDIRDKPERKICAKMGIADEKGRIKEAYKDYTAGLLREVNAFFAQSAD